MKRNPRSIFVFLALLLLFAGGGWLAFRFLGTAILLQRGRQAYEAGDYGVASRLLTAALVLDEGNEAACVLMGNVLEAEGRWPEAANYRGWALKENSQNYDYARAYVHSLLMGRCFQMIVTYFKGPEHVSLSQEELCQFLFARIMASGAEDEAKVWKHFGEEHPDLLQEPYPRLVKLMFFSNGEDIQAVERELNSLSASDDVAVAQEAFLALAAVRRRMGDQAGVEAALASAQALNDFIVTPFLADYYVDHGDLDQAADVLETYLKRYKNHEMAILFGECLALEGDAERIQEQIARMQGETDEKSLRAVQYLSALMAFANEDFKAMNDAFFPIRAWFGTQTALLVALMADCERNDLVQMEMDYMKLLDEPPLVDVRQRANEAVLEHLWRRLEAGDAPGDLMRLAELLETEGGLTGNVRTASIVLRGKLDKNILSEDAMLEALGQFDRDPAILEVAADYYCHRGKFSQALELARTIGETTDDQGERMVRLQCHCLEWMGRLDEASTQFECLLARYPTWENVLEYWKFACRHGRADDWRNLRKLGEGGGEAAKLVPFCRIALDLDGDDETKRNEALDRLAAMDIVDDDMLFFAADAFARFGRDDEAEIRFGKISAAFEQRWRVFVGLARIHARKNNLEQALTTAFKALENSPMEPEVQECCAVLLRLCGDWRTALDVIRSSEFGQSASAKTIDVWIWAMESSIRFDYDGDRMAVARKSCQDLLLHDPANTMALETLAKINSASER